MNKEVKLNETCGYIRGLNHAIEIIEAIEHSEFKVEYTDDYKVLQKCKKLFIDKLQNYVNNHKKENLNTIIPLNY